MNEQADQAAAAPIATRPDRFPALAAPFLHAPEGARTVFMVTFAAACGPLLAGLVLFGWRVGIVAAISIATCAAVERVYYFVSRTPAMLGRSHAYLTGLLLALTLPPHVPWYVPMVAAVFAIVLGKAIFGGVGHFIWQPALVGRLAVAVLFAGTLAGPVTGQPEFGAILAQNRLLVGDIRIGETQQVDDFRQWRGHRAPDGSDAILVRTPASILKQLTLSPQPAFRSLASSPMANSRRAKPAAVMKLPAINDLIYGARPGGIGETCAIVIIVAGLYLVYRNYTKLHLPLAFILAAAVVAAVAPISLGDSDPPGSLVWLPVLAEQLDIGLVYVSYQLLSGQLLLAAFFLATEMTSRPVTTGGQVIFALLGGAVAMLLTLYFDTPIPAYMAVLAVNTVALTIDALWRPRVMGQRHFALLFGRKR